MLHNAVVLYRRTITFTYIVWTNHKSRLRIPTVRLSAVLVAAAPYITSLRVALGDMPATQLRIAPEGLGGIDVAELPGVDMWLTGALEVRRCRLNTSGRPWVESTLGFDQLKVRPFQSYGFRCCQPAPLHHGRRCPRRTPARWGSPR